MAGKWHEFLEQVLARPNTWAHTPWFYTERISAKQYTSNVHVGFQHGRFPMHHPDGAEVKLPEDGYFESHLEERPTDSGQWVVWAKWIPNANMPPHITPAEEVRRVIKAEANRGASPKRSRRSSRR